MSDRYYESIIARGGGIVTLGGHLGVIVGPAEAARRCPAGWGFVDVETATVAIVRETIDQVPRNMAAFRSELPQRGRR